MNAIHTDPGVIVAAAIIGGSLAFFLAAAALAAIGWALGAAFGAGRVWAGALAYERQLRARNTANPLPPTTVYAARTWRLGRDAGDANGIYDSAQWALEAAALPPATHGRHAAPDDDTVDLGRGLPATVPLPVERVREYAGVER
jgi:hypothetical protein